MDKSSLYEGFARHKRSDGWKIQRKGRGYLVERPSVSQVIYHIKGSGQRLSPAQRERAGRVR
jgi:hypothetical protein